MNVPALVLGSLIAASCALLYHILRGGPLRRLVLYLGAAMVSFFIGHLLGEWFNVLLLRFGALNLFSALLATLIGLFVSDALAGSSPPSQRDPPPRRRRGRR